MATNYKNWSVDELWTEIKRKYGDETQAVFDDKEKLAKESSQDGGLLDEYFDRISRGN